MSEEKKEYMVRFEMLGKDGIVPITVDDRFTEDDAISYLEQNIDWMHSASIYKVKETFVAKVTSRKDLVEIRRG